MPAIFFLDKMMVAYTKNAIITFDDNVCTLIKKEPIYSVVLRWVVLVSCVLFSFFISALSFMSPKLHFIGWGAGGVGLVVLGVIISAFLRSGWKLTDHFTYCFIDRAGKTIRFSYDGKAIGKEFNFSKINKLVIRSVLKTKCKYYFLVAKCDIGDVDLYTFVLSQGYDLEEEQLRQISAWSLPLAEWLGVELKVERSLS